MRSAFGAALGSMWSGCPVDERWSACSREDRRAGTGCARSSLSNCLERCDSRAAPRDSGARGGGPTARVLGSAEDAEDWPICCGNRGGARVDVVARGMSRCSGPFRIARRQLRGAHGFARSHSTARRSVRHGRRDGIASAALARRTARIFSAVWPKRGCPWSMTRVACLVASRRWARRGHRGRFSNWSCAFPQESPGESFRSRGSLDLGFYPAVVVGRGRGDRLGIQAVFWAVVSALGCELSGSGLFVAPARRQGVFAGECRPGWLFCCPGSRACDGFRSADTVFGSCVCGDGLAQ